MMRAGTVTRTHAFVYMRKQPPKEQECMGTDSQHKRLYTVSLYVHVL